MWIDNHCHLPADDPDLAAVLVAQGIVAGVTRVLGEANVDIRDITQSIIEDIFTMTMLADTAESKLDFAELQKALAEAGELSGVNVSIQREDVFNFMYRL